MKIRGDLKVLHDLVVQTAANDPAVGKLLYSKNGTGKVIWSDLIIHEPVPGNTYDKGSLVFNILGTEVYIANVDDAPGGDLDSDKWMKLSGGGGGGVITFADKAAMDATTGIDSTIYIVKDVNALYRWNSTKSEFISIVGIQDTVKASITVGGIIAGDDVLRGTNLHDFIDQLVNPEIKAALVSPYLSYSIGVNLSSSEPIGSKFILAYTNTYKPGDILGYTVDGASTRVDQKGSNSVTNIPVSGTSHIVVETNKFSGVCSYSGGLDPIYSSTKQIDTAINRAGGVFPTKEVTVKGYYPVYMGGTTFTEPISLSAALSSGSIPAGSVTIDHFNAGFSETDTTVAQGNPYIYIALPASTYSNFDVITSHHDTVLVDSMDKTTFSKRLLFSVADTTYDLYMYLVTNYPGGEDMTITINR